MSLFSSRPHLMNFLRTAGVYARQILAAVLILWLMHLRFGANENYPALLTASGGFFTVLSLTWSLARRATGDAALRTEDVGEMNQLITITAVTVTFAGVVAESKLQEWGLWMIIVTAIAVTIIFAVFLFGLAPGGRAREKKAAAKRALRAKRRATPEIASGGYEQEVGAKR